MIAQAGPSTFEIFDEFSPLGISMKACTLVIKNEIVDCVSGSWLASDSDKTMRNIWSRLSEEHTKRAVRALEFSVMNSKTAVADISTK